MKDDILTYREMCDRESVQTLQRGMNYRLSLSYSVILMSQRRNAPYEDEVSGDGKTISYEGHDWPKTAEIPIPKTVDQPMRTKTGTLTQNGKFVEAVERYTRDGIPEKVRIYEKILAGVWFYKGTFELISYTYPVSRGRHVFKFRLHLVSEEIDATGQELRERSRVIPTAVKKLVWERDHGKCVLCGAKDELHFDHIIPFSKGGTSITPDNVRILCARHNLSKSAKIE